MAVDNGTVAGHVGGPVRPHRPRRPPAARDEPRARHRARVDRGAGLRGGPDAVSGPGAGSRRAARSADCDLVLALGGDGTTLAALHAAAPPGRPVLGIACGSLGALTAVAGRPPRATRSTVSRRRVEPRSACPRWVAERRRGPRRDQRPRARPRGRRPGDLRDPGRRRALRPPRRRRIVAATPPARAPTRWPPAARSWRATRGDRVTPLATHGGCCPPLVVGPEELRHVYRARQRRRAGGARRPGPRRSRAARAARHRARLDDYATLVGLGDEEPLLAGLRRRRILMDSPRVLARDDREGARTA